MLLYSRADDAAALVADMIDMTAHVEPARLAAGIRHWRLTQARWPQVAQLLRACEDAERNADPDAGDRAVAYARCNRETLMAGGKLFFTATGDQFMEGPQEPRRVMPDGTVRVLA